MSSGKEAQSNGGLPIVNKQAFFDEEIHNFETEKVLQNLSEQCPPFYKNRNLLRLYLLMVPGCLVPAVTLGFDGAMLNGLQSVPNWDSYFNHPRGSLLGFLTSVLSFGAICGAPFVSYVGDKFGRRCGIFLGGTIMLFGAILQSVSTNYATFLVARFILGFGMVFSNTYAPVLIGELSHTKDRMVATSLYQTSWYLGSICAAWVTFGTFAMPNEWSWRIPSLLQAVPALIQMSCVWFLPESPRWLLAQGQAVKAKQVLIKHHANGNEKDEYVNLAFTHMEQVITREMSVKTEWKTLVATPGNRRRMLIIVLLGLFSQWSGNGLVSYYLTRVLETIGVTNPRDQTMLNGCLQTFNWITAVSSAFLTAKLKRRTQFMISVTGMLTIFAFQTLCAGLFNEQHNKAAGIGVIPLLFLFYLFFNLAFNALLYSYPVEFLPYSIRAKGMSVLMFFGKGAALVNAYVNPLGLQAFGWKYYCLYVGWLCFEVVMVYLIFVETKGPSLEAISSLFDGSREAVTRVAELEESRETTTKNLKG